MADQINDGGPAAPQMTRDPWGNYHQTGGMSLRDWFAGQALAGFCSAHDASGTWSSNPEAAAVNAYMHADAMLAARSRPDINIHADLVKALQIAVTYVETTFARCESRRQDGAKLPADHPVRVDLATIQAALRKATSP